ncbi:hypothetical protein FSP39_014750 [Pinctada imbricata]|uniref:tRNA pseudouridine(55) synthase n=1 Tax=Pinctada imbricata TaxID=66713 RepID=A0AA88XWV2_PINIB|nr:hypothetical protein FSP39_014750 [Pinctada imbricata]
MKLYSSDETEIKSIGAELVDSGCCPHCILRYLGQMDPSVYRQSFQEVKSTVSWLQYGDRDADLYSKQPCPACLGILQYFLDEDFIDRILQTVRSSDYEYRSFICSITTPVSVLVREHCLLIQLREKFDAIYGLKVVTDLPSIKDVWKWKIGPTLSKHLDVTFDAKSSFDIAMIFEYPDSDKECAFLSDYFPELFRKRKSNKMGIDDRFSRLNVTKALSEIPDDFVIRKKKVPPCIPTQKCRCAEIKCSYDSVFLAGRYNKYSRTLSQTPWFVDGTRKSSSSVEEEICNLLKDMFRYDEHRFSASGREDVDVRMLGTGRPFVVEMQNPHRIKFSQEKISELQKEINHRSTDVKIRDLQFVSREDTNKLKEGEMEKTKRYIARCWSESPLTTEDLEKLQTYKDLMIYQKTPIRVLHRRPLATRERTIYSMSAEKLDDHHFSLYLSTQAGTYIKEFVHGDFGRTKPNMSEITGTECDILELDVQPVNGGRSSAMKAVLVMTDGKSSNYPLTKSEADELRKNLSAEVFAIGIGAAAGSTSNIEIPAIASDPDDYYTYYVKSYEVLCSLIPSIVPKLGKIEIKQHPFIL